MTIHAWLAFALASALLGLVPGPGVLSIVGYARQAAVLVLTFCGIVGLTDTAYALTAARAARLLATPRAALIASGLVTAAQR